LNRSVALIFLKPRVRKKLKQLSPSFKKKGACKEKEEKKLRIEIVQISNTIKRIDRALIGNEKNKGLTPNQAKQLAKLNGKLEVQKNLESQKNCSKRRNC
tara:strand:- start:252 stop:551 length:300 start_codon:yes stop_codon:yes gene_type:complete